MQKKKLLIPLALLLSVGAVWGLWEARKIRHLEKIAAPQLAREAGKARQQAMRSRVEKRLAQDQSKYSPAQLAEAEQMFQTARKHYGDRQYTNVLQQIIEKYPDSNRAGCAALYIAELTQGDTRAEYLQDCLYKYNDCFFMGGRQVGPYARYLLAQDLRRQGRVKEAEALTDEIKEKYSDAVDENGNLLVDELKKHKWLK